MKDRARQPAYTALVPPPYCPSHPHQMPARRGTWHVLHPSVNTETIAEHFITFTFFKITLKLIVYVSCKGVTLQ